VARALQIRSVTMPTTTSTFSSLASITAADLSFVQGGCGKKRCCCPPCPPPQPAAAPVAAAPAPRESIETSVQISGYGA
jgi:hypothetical protein